MHSKARRLVSALIVARPSLAAGGRAWPCFHRLQAPATSGSYAARLNSPKSGTALGRHTDQPLQKRANPYLCYHLLDSRRHLKTGKNNICNFTTNRF